jgi:hypothetical protein
LGKGGGRGNADTGKIKIRIFQKNKLLNMNNNFIVAIRKAVRALPPSDATIDELHKMRVELMRKAEEIILKNEVIGKRFLRSNLEELKTEMQYVDALVISKLSDLSKMGLDDYDSKYANTKEVALAIEEAIFTLQKLWKIYFEDQHENIPAPKQPTSMAKKIFVSYSHKDEEYMKELDKFLGPLERKGEVSIWTDRKILPGQNWKEEILRELECADLTVLLVSANFLDSDFINMEEIPRAFKRREDAGKHVVPIILNFCLWNITDLGSLQATPKDGRPIADFSNQVQAWNEVARAILNLINNM